MVDVLINVLAAWVQQRTFPNQQFSAQGITILVVAIIVGLVIVERVGGVSQTGRPSPVDPATTLTVTGVRSKDSKLKVSGRGIHVADSKFNKTEADFDVDRQQP